jgi:2-keto-4-pentenoate hydratase/2-oxohepta-3-ene-1,7-dioic acid hydratase in catechol pathway
MKIGRAMLGREIFYCILEGESVKPLGVKPFSGILMDGRELSVHDVKLLAPCEPSKIVAVGLNYASHANEMKEDLHNDPVLFIKPSTAVLNPKEAIVYPAGVTRVDYEAELGVVIGRTCRNVTEEQAASYIFGYTCLNDVTARDLQKKDGQWTRAKGFDTFCPFGPHIETEYDWHNKRVQSFLNGEPRQDSDTGSLMFGVEKLVSYISSVMTLLPGDVIATGTPEGIGPMQKGDTVQIVVEGIGTLENRVE